MPSQSHCSDSFNVSELSGARKDDAQPTYISNAKAPVKMVVRKTAFLRKRDLKQRNGPVSSVWFFGCRLSDKEGDVLVNDGSDL